MAERVLDGPLRRSRASRSSSQPGDEPEAAAGGRAVVWSRSHEHRDLDGIVLGVVPFGVVLLQAHLLATLAEIPVPGLGHEPW